MASILYESTTEKIRLTRGWNFCEQCGKLIKPQAEAQELLCLLCEHLKKTGWMVQFQNCKIGIGCIISKDSISISALADNHASALSIVFSYLKNIREV